MNTLAAALQRSRIALNTIRLIADNIASGAPPFDPDMLGFVLMLCAETLDPGFDVEEPTTFPVEKHLPSAN